MTSRTLIFFFLAAVLTAAGTTPTVQRGLTVTVLQGGRFVHALASPASRRKPDSGDRMEGAY